jgi:hypothetical protein
MATEPALPAARGAGDGIAAETYDLLRGRLAQHARELAERANALNAERHALFGQADMVLVGTERIRTDNNCVPRDIVAIGEHLVLGFNVFIGLRSEVLPRDVFALHHFVREDDGLRFDPAPLEAIGLAGSGELARDFAEVYAYYRQATLDRLHLLPDRLLAVFRTGSLASDRKVLRWSVARDGGLAYLDSRGERDYVLPPSHDFEWTATTRDDHVDGRHPHVSILDELFVEAIGGDLTIKVENNTDSGEGIYAEPVDDANQSLEDAEIGYARVGALILLRIRPYREQRFRHLVYNTRTRTVARIDAIEHACVELPESHGVVFPGGYYLHTGESKAFDGDVRGMELLRKVRAQNGEDTLYVFHERYGSRYVLLRYNSIERKLDTPIHCHGYTLFADGRMIVFRAESDEPVRVHAMQIWQTPFASEDLPPAAPRDSFLERIGNAELVRAISDALAVASRAEQPAATRAHYEDLIAAVSRALDHYHWLGDDSVALLGPLKRIGETADLAVHEFEKVRALSATAADAVARITAEIDALARRSVADGEGLEARAAALGKLRHKRGELIALRDLRYVDLERLAELEATLAARASEQSRAAVAVLLESGALAPFVRRIDALGVQAEACTRSVELAPVRASIDALGGELEALAEVVASLEIEDSAARTGILGELSEVFGALNRVKALAASLRDGMRSRESSAEFGAELLLLGQAVTSALASLHSPEACDAALGRLTVQIESLESRFGELEEHQEKLARKREDVCEAVALRKQALLDERQRRTDQAARAAERILETLERRAQTFTSAADLHAFFASDPMVAKLRSQIDALAGLGAGVRADELFAGLRAARDEAARALRDKQDIFEDGAATLRLGRHRFTVHTEPFELAAVPRDGELVLHVTGTDLYAPIEDAAFRETRPFFEQALLSETAEIYRAEYLAGCMLLDAAAKDPTGAPGSALAELRAAAAAHEDLLPYVRAYAAPRYDEGYERGVHDADAALILGALVRLHAGAGVLCFEPTVRARAVLFFAHQREPHARLLLERRAQSLHRLRGTFGHAEAIMAFVGDITGAMRTFFERHGAPQAEPALARSSEYLFEELGRSGMSFALSRPAHDLVHAFRQELALRGTALTFEEDLRALENDLAACHGLAVAWVAGYVSRSGGDKEAARYVEEAAVAMLCEPVLQRTVEDAPLGADVTGLLGQHPRVRERTLCVRLDEMLARIARYRAGHVPAYRRYLEQRTALLAEQRKTLGIDRLRPRVMSAFVRSRLIDSVYLPIIGDNLAKQMGAQGDAGRTDRMGLLMLISPPGYGKTTLMEYVAERLGMAFMKIDGPALGHTVSSLDPAEAPNVAARREVERINFAFELGSNVLLYLDDIQHTNAELLQKFISLCDGQRKIEGVWNGAARSYDMRGKRFAICMAGNPYTESGTRFKVPDMLANRADIYNLGDILSGKEDVFELSYIENAVTSNPVLAPLAGRDPADVVALVRRARGGEGASAPLSHPYSAVELEEILAVLRRLLRIQEVVLAVNRAYIQSASTDDAFRTAPPFKLQGSYRNMNKMAEKVVALMNDAELEALIDDHYQGEAQTLTSGAEHNLLKLRELRGTMTDADRTRWQAILRELDRLRLVGRQSEDDPVARVTGQLSLLADRVDGIGTAIRHATDATSDTSATAETVTAALTPVLAGLERTLAAVADGSAQRAATQSDAEPSAAAAPLAAAAAALESIDATLRSAVEQQSARSAAAPGPAPSQPEAAGSPATLAPYLDRLDATLQTLAHAPRGSEVVQTLGPGVRDLLEKMTARISDLLLPTLRKLEKRAQLGEAERHLKADVNRILKHFDMLRDLLDALAKIDTRDVARRLRKTESKSTGHDAGDEG